MRRALLVTLLVAAQMATANTPATSLRPVARGGNPVVQPVQMAPSGAIEQPAQDEASETARDRGGLFSSLRPLFRSSKVEKTGREKRRLEAKGAICGDVAIQGEAIGRVPGKIGGCGIESAVRVRSVSGISLSQSATVDCVTAQALKRWVDTSAKPALSRQGGGLKGLRVAAHYACRSRNNVSGAKISEHGKGRAIDISGFQLANGSEVTVLQGWGSKSSGKALARMRKEACSTFGTVLGPGSDGYHRDHFHFDTARHRNGSYCR